MIVRHVVRNRQRTRADRFLIGFSTVLLALNTIYWTTQAYFGEQMWIVHADYPGGMDAYLADNVAVWYQTWGTAAVTISNLMADALMVSEKTVWLRDPGRLIGAVRCTAYMSYGTTRTWLWSQR